MRVEVTRADWRRAREVYRLFKAKPHSEHIASEFALAHLAAVLRTNEIKSVLEFGAGIGTATYLILSSRPETRVDCTENVPLCLDALEANIPPTLRKRLAIHLNGEALSGPFDLVITDGGTNVGSLRLKEGGLCFAEGNRRAARAKITTAAERQGLTCQFSEYDKPYLVIRWWRLRLFRRKQLRPRIVPYAKRKKEKGCWIGRVEAHTPA